MWASTLLSPVFRFLTLQHYVETVSCPTSSSSSIYSHCVFSHWTDGAQSASASDSAAAPSGSVHRHKKHTKAHSDSNDDSAAGAGGRCDFGETAYGEACDRLGITQVQRVVTGLSTSAINLKYRSLGPRGAKALAAALNVRHSLQLSVFHRRFFSLLNIEPLLKSSSEANELSTTDRSLIYANSQTPVRDSISVSAFQLTKCIIVLAEAVNWFNKSWRTKLPADMSKTRFLIREHRIYLEMYLGISSLTSQYWLMSNPCFFLWTSLSWLEHRRVGHTLSHKLSSLTRA